MKHRLFPLNRRAWFSALASGLVSAGQGAQAAKNESVAPKALDLRAFTASDGALCMYKDHSAVEPYFGLKAITIAQRFGWRSTTATQAWLVWLKAHQESNGSVGRYHNHALFGGRPQWTKVADADADDSLLALLLQAHAYFGMNLVDAPSLQRAWTGLQALVSPKTGLYRASNTYPVAYWMDNIEVSDALDSMAAIRPLAGAWPQPPVLKRMNLALWQAMLQVFAPWPSLTPAVADIAYIPAAPAFYPHHVAAPFAWLHENPRPIPGEPSARFAAWHSRFGDEWASMADSAAPWGLIALCARQEGHNDEAQRHVTRTEHVSKRADWNVLEETCRQILLKP